MVSLLFAAASLFFALVSDFLAAVAEFADAVCESAAACALLPEQVEVIPARYLQMRCWNVRDGRGGRSE
ncbi:TPA: hypothetical protein JLN41_001234 [Escherichia coli]|nr:hypothetical protein [Escherichia coli]HAW2394012.1 hypothetical protein [Escherichia coli]HAW7936904.1 hypothetical protein [Escherichia coli]